MTMTCMAVLKRKMGNGYRGKLATRQFIKFNQIMTCMVTFRRK